MRWKIVTLTAAGVALAGWALVALVFPRPPLSLGALLLDAGTLERVEMLEHRGEDGRRYQDLLLVSSRGTTVSCRILAPGNVAPRPAGILLGGLRTGRRAVEHVPPNQNMVWLSLDYPTVDLSSQRPLDYLRRAPELAEGVQETLRSILLALDYLESRPDVNAGRTLIAGGSLGSFFAVMAGSMEPRFEAVATLYGGGDLSRLIEANLTFDGRLRRRAAAAALSWWTRRLEPTRYVAGISPRPLLMVNGKADPRMPAECVESLYRAAREPKELVWLEGNHPGTKAFAQSQDEQAVTRIVVQWLEDQGWLEPGPL